MNEPVNLTNLREMTDGDVEMEKMLFEEFFSSSEECILLMGNNCEDGENEGFRSSAHALKGTAINLGAETLSNLCKYAQENYTASSAEKQTMIDNIKEEYHKAKAFLQEIY